MPSATALNGARGCELSLSLPGNFDCMCVYVHTYVCMGVSVAEALAYVFASALSKPSYAGCSLCLALIASLSFLPPDRVASVFCFRRCWHL